MMENLVDYSGGSSRTSKSSIGSNSPIPYFYHTGDENSPASRIPPSAKLRNSFSASTTNSPGGLFRSAYAAPDDFAGEIDLAVLRRAAGTRLALPASKSLFLPIEPKRVPRSPLSPIENLLPPSPPLFKVKAAAAHVGGEGVLVMDGVLLEEHPASGGSAKTRSGSRSSGSTTDSTASSTVAGVFHHGLYKTDLCRPWEVLGSCRYGSNCQFAHGKEELRQSRRTKSRNESDHEMVRHANHPSTKDSNLRSNSPSPRSVEKVWKVAPSMVLRTPPSSPMGNVNRGGAPVQGTPEDSPTSRLAQMKLVEEMDAEEIALCEEPSLLSILEELMIRRRKRLPVFEEICPSADIDLLG